jgi:hypothetical protein
VHLREYLVLPFAVLAEALKRMQEGHQVVELPLVENHVERRHVAASCQNSVADVLVGCRHSAWEGLLSEHANERRTLQGLFLVGVVADGATRLVDFTSVLLLNTQRATRCRG